MFHEVDKYQKLNYFKDSKYKFIKKLGNKLYGTVYLVEDQTDFKKYCQLFLVFFLFQNNLRFLIFRKALKTINSNVKAEEVKMVLNEIRHLKNIRSPYFVSRK